MADINPDLKPILEMFAVQLRHPNVSAALKDWRNTLSKGMLHFGRKENLDKGLDFNTLIYTDLNPSPSKSGQPAHAGAEAGAGGRCVGCRALHRQFHYLKGEMVIVRATGRWDYARNDGPYDLKMASEVTVRLSDEAAKTSRLASEKVLKEVGRLCFSWLVVNKMTMGGNA